MDCLLDLVSFIRILCDFIVAWRSCGCWNRSAVIKPGVLACVGSHLLLMLCLSGLHTPRPPSAQILETEEWGQKVHEGIACMAFCCFAGHNSIQRYCNSDLLQCRTAASHWMPESPLRSFWSFGQLTGSWQCWWWCGMLVDFAVIWQRQAGLLTWYSANCHLLGNFCLMFLVIKLYQPPAPSIDMSDL